MKISHRYPTPFATKPSEALYGKATLLTHDAF